MASENDTPAKLPTVARHICGEEKMTLRHMRLLLLLAIVLLALISNWRFAQRDRVSMLFQLYSLYLLWRYRDREPTALSSTFVFLAHLPVLDYAGWHYTISAWFFWSAHWALVAKLIWLNLTQPTTQLKHILGSATAPDANLNQH